MAAGTSPPGLRRRPRSKVADVKLSCPGARHEISGGDDALPHLLVVSAWRQGVIACWRRKARDLLAIIDQRPGDAASPESAMRHSRCSRTATSATARCSAWPVRFRRQLPDRFERGAQPRATALGKVHMAYAPTTAGGDREPARRGLRHSHA